MLPNIPPPPVIPMLDVLNILVEKAGVLDCWLNEWPNGCCPIVGEDVNSPDD